MLFALCGLHLWKSVPKGEYEHLPHPVSELDLFCHVSTFRLRDWDQRVSPGCWYSHTRLRRKWKRRQPALYRKGREAQARRWRGVSLGGPFSRAPASSCLEKQTGGLLVPAAPRINWLFLQFVFNCLNLLKNCSDNNAPLLLGKFRRWWRNYSILHLDGCLQNILQLVAFSNSCVLRRFQSHLPHNSVPTLLSSLMPYDLVPRSTHASAPRLTYIEAKALSLLSGILKFSEVQAKRVKSRLAVPLGCRVRELCCKGGLGQASTLEDYRDTLSNTVSSKHYLSWSVTKAGVV